MKIKPRYPNGVTISTSNLTTCIAKAGGYYNNNLEARTVTHPTGRQINFTIRGKASGGHGTLYRRDEVPSVDACWHAHRDVIFEILLRHPHVKIETHLATYNTVEHFLSTYQGTEVTMGRGGRKCACTKLETEAFRLMSALADTESLHSILCDSFMGINRRGNECGPVARPVYLGGRTYDVAADTSGLYALRRAENDALLSVADIKRLGAKLITNLKSAAFVHGNEVHIELASLTNGIMHGLGMCAEMGAKKDGEPYLKHRHRKLKAGAKGWLIPWMADFRRF